MPYAKIKEGILAIRPEQVPQYHWALLSQYKRWISSGVRLRFQHLDNARRIIEAASWD